MKISVSLAIIVGAITLVMVAAEEEPLTVKTFVEDMKVMLNAFKNLGDIDTRFAVSKVYEKERAEEEKKGGKCPTPTLPWIIEKTNIEKAKPIFNLELLKVILESLEALL